MMDVAASKHSAMIGLVNGPRRGLGTTVVGSLKHKMTQLQFARTLWCCRGDVGTAVLRRQWPVAGVSYNSLVSTNLNSVCVCVCVSNFSCPLSQITRKPTVKRFCYNFLSLTQVLESKVSECDCD